MITHLDNWANLWFYLTYNNQKVERIDTNSAGVSNITKSMSSVEEIRQAYHLTPLKEIDVIMGVIGKVVI